MIRKAKAVWRGMAEREKRWGAFLADPEWIAVVAKSEKDGQLVENISSQLLAPAAFSAVKSDSGCAHDSLVSESRADTPRR
jgi:NIPSNAP